MRICELINEINNLPNLLYVYWNSSDNKDHLVILGGQSCILKNEYTNMNMALHYNEEMQTIYEKDILKETDKYRLVKMLARIRNSCDYRHSGLGTLTQQEAYLRDLNQEQLEEISKQVEMYKYVHRLSRV